VIHAEDNGARHGYGHDPGTQYDVPGPDENATQHRTDENHDNDESRFDSGQENFERCVCISMPEISDQVSYDK